MSPRRSKAIDRPSGLTSTFIQVPSLTFSGTCLSTAPGGALTSQAAGSRAGRAGAASAVVETSRSESAAKLRTICVEPPGTWDEECSGGALFRQYGQAGRLRLIRLPQVVGHAASAGQ